VANGSKKSEAPPHIMGIAEEKQFAEKQTMGVGKQMRAIAKARFMNGAATTDHFPIAQRLAERSEERRLKERLPPGGEGG